MFNVLLSGASSQESGWISETCWMPPTLPLGAYTWNVRARDDSEQQSGTSPDWVFTLVSSTILWDARYFSGNLHWADVNDTSNQICSETLELPTLDKDYGDGSPCNDETVDNRVGDYTATVDFLPGDYVFEVKHDDGLKIYLDGEIIMERADASAPRTLCPALYLSGEHELWAVLREDTEQARARLSWSMDTSPCDLPGAYGKSDPANAAVDQPVNLTLGWSDSTGASSYEYCYHAGGDGTCDGEWMDAGSDTSVSITGLNYSKTIHGRCVLEMGTEQPKPTAGYGGRS